MRYIVGLDGGGTKTTGYISDTNGKILAASTNEGANYRSLGLERAKKNIDNIIKSLCYKTNIDIEDITLISLGLAGADRDEDRKVIMEILSNLGYRCQTMLNNDAVTALVGAVGEAKGVITISGTGSICYGIDSYGTVKRAGGWGHIIGDEGSGYYIGRRALEVVVKAQDYRGPKTVLQEKILNFLSLKSVHDIIGYVYDSKTTKEQIAKLAPIVINSAEEGDSVSIQIIDDSVNSLVEMTEAVINQLNFNNETIRLSVGGGILINANPIRRKFTEGIMEKFQNIDIFTPLFDGGIGALIIGWNHLKINYDLNKLGHRIKEVGLNG